MKAQTSRLQPGSGAALIGILVLAAVLSACASVNSGPAPPTGAESGTQNDSPNEHAAARPDHGGSRAAPGPRPPPRDGGGGGGGRETDEAVLITGLRGMGREPEVTPNTASTRQSTSASPTASDAGSDAIDAMPKANFAFNSPATLELNQTTQIQLRVSLAESIDQLKAEIQAAGAIEAGQVPVSNRIEAKLTGMNFEIRSVSDDVQLLGSRHTTEWSWDVKALEEGEQVLHLSLTSILTVDGQEVRRSFPSLDRKIIVQVSAVNRASLMFGKYWQWLMTAVFIPLFGWGVKKLRGRAAAQPAAAH